MPGNEKLIAALAELARSREAVPHPHHGDQLIVRSAFLFGASLIASLDGQFSDATSRKLGHYAAALDLTPEQLADALSALDKPDAEEITCCIIDVLTDLPHKILLMLDLHAIAAADGALSPARKDALKSFGKMLQLPGVLCDFVAKLNKSIIAQDAAMINEVLASRAAEKHPIQFSWLYYLFDTIPSKNKIKMPKPVKIIKARM